MDSLVRRIGYFAVCLTGSLIAIPMAANVMAASQQEPVMQRIVISGGYAVAISTAYGDWRSHNWKARIEDQTIDVAPASGRNLLYVHFLPRFGPRLTLGCATPFGVEITYLIDVAKRSVVQKKMPC